MPTAASLPLACAFAGQCVLIAAAFVAVILVLTERQREEYELAINARIALAQANASQSILLPFLTREAKFDITRQRVLGNPTEYLMDDNSTLESMLPFIEETFLPVFSDDLITNFAQISASDGFFHPNGDRFWSLCGTSEDLWVAIAKNGTGRYVPQTSYPITIAASAQREVPYDVTYDAMVAVRDVPKMMWTRARPFANPFTSTLSYGITLAAPLRRPNPAAPSTNALLMAMRIDIIRLIVRDGLLSPSTLALLVDATKGDVWVTSDPNVPHFSTEGSASSRDGVSWTLATLPNRAQVAEYTTMIKYCPHTVCGYDRRQLGKNIVTLVNIRTGATGLNLHLQQSTPRSFFFATSDRDRAIGIAIGVVAAIVVIVTSVCVSIAIHRPLTRLQVGMGNAAVMRNEEARDASGALSLLTEVRHIQLSFLAMNSKLMAARPFMPQHLLLDTDLSGGEDDEGDGMSEGEAADELASEVTRESTLPTVTGVKKRWGAGYDELHSDGTQSLGSHLASGAVSPAVGPLRSPNTHVAAGAFPPVAVGLSPMSHSFGVLGVSATRIATVTAAGAVTPSARRLSAANNPPSRSPRRRDLTVAHPCDASGSAADAVRTKPRGRQAHPQSATHTRVSASTDTSAKNIVVGGPSLPAARHQALASRRAGVLIVNFRGFHALTAGRTMDGFGIICSELCSLVEASASAERGVVDAFHGDHFTVTFNVARPIGNAGRSGSLVATRLVRDVEQRVQLRDALLTTDSALFSDSWRPNDQKETAADVVPKFSMGLSVGRAIVGNMGSDTMKKLCVVGNVFTEAVALERLARTIGQNCCFLEKCLDGIDSVAYSLIVGKIKTNANSPKHETARAIMEHISAYSKGVAANDTTPAAAEGGGASSARAKDEWMYEMSARKQIDPFHLLNEAMAKYLSGDCSRECAEHLASASSLAIAKGDYHTPQVLWAADRLASLRAMHPSCIHYDASRLGTSAAGMSRETFEHMPKT